MAIGADGRWHPGIGDPTIGGWITVAGYFGAAILAYRALRLHHKEQSPSTSTDQRTLVRFWLIVLCAMALLGLNKQLDLQSWFTEVGRDLAKAQGWYQERRSVQTLFIAALVVGGLTGMAVIAFSLRRVISRVTGAVLGLCFLAMFVAVRAASFHHVDRWLGYGVVRVNWALELGGIALIAISAWRQTPYRRRLEHSARTRASRSRGLYPMILDVGLSKESRFFILLGLAYSGLYVATGLQDLSIAHDSAVYLASAAAGEATIHPNHLLYGPLAAAVVRCFQAIGLSADRALSTLDGLAGGLVMTLVGLILVRRGKLRVTDAALASMPIGLSFGVWFYSAGIEIYLPALVPLLGALYILSGRMEDRRDWAAAGALHGAAALMHQSHVLFAIVPILSAALSQGPARQKLGRFAIYVGVAAALVGPAYLLAALAVGAGPDLPGLLGWAAGYAGTGNSYWATPPNNFVKAATGFARAQIGGLFVFAVPQLSSAVASVFPVEPWDGPFLVRSMSVALGLAMAATAASAALMSAAALATAVVRAQQLFEGGPRRLTILLLAAIVPYSAFFSFWQPHNPEFWIAQSIFLWLAIGVSLLGPGRRARTGAWLVGAVGALYGVVTLTSAIIPAMDVQNDYFWRLLDSAPKGSVASLVVVDRHFPLKAYARLARYPLVLSVDLAGDNAVSVALQHLAQGKVVLLAGATSDGAARLSGHLPSTFVRKSSEDGRTIRIEPQQ